MSRHLITLATIAFVFAASPISFACDLCRDAVINNPNGMTARAGLDFNFSIVLLLGTLFTAAGFVARVIVKATKSQD